MVGIVGEELKSQQNQLKLSRRVRSVYAPGGHDDRFGMSDEDVKWDLVALAEG